jgi:hypothetical protein
MGHDHQDEQEAARHSPHDEEIRGRNLANVIREECAPRL